MPEGLPLPEITFSGVMASIVFSAIGYWLWRQGKQRARYDLMVVSVLMMGYTYLTHGPLQDWGGGLLLCGLAYYLWDR